MPKCTVRLGIINSPQYCCLCCPTIHFKMKSLRVGFCHFSTAQLCSALKDRMYQNTQDLVPVIPVEQKYLGNCYKLLGEHLQFLWRWNYITLTELPALFQFHVFTDLLSNEFFKPHIMMLFITWRFLIAVSDKSAALQKMFHTNKVTMRL